MRTRRRLAAILVAALAALAGGATAAPAPVAATTPSSAFHDAGGSDLFDSRSFFGGGRLTPGVERAIVVVGVFSTIPAARRVALRLTAISPAGQGFVRAHRCGAFDPAAPAALRLVRDGDTEVAWADVTAGLVCVTSTVATDLTARVEGYEDPADPGGLSFVSRPAVQLAVGLPVAAGGVSTLRIAGTLGVPAGTPLVSLIVEAAGDEASDVRLYACDQGAPPRPTLRHAAGASWITTALGRLSGQGDLCIAATAATTVTVELNGWWSATEAATASGPVQHLFETIPSPGFVAVTPSRAFDTRDGAAVAVATGGTYELDLASRALAGATDVVLNVTVTEPSAAGYVTVYPCSSPRPLASNLNVVTGQTVPNLVVAALGDDDRVCFYASVGTHLLADVTGWFVLGGGTGLVTRTPSRLFDTRSAAALGAGATYELDVAPKVDAEATAVVMNVTFTEATAAGYVTVYPCDAARPTASNLNTVAGSTGSNLVMVSIGASKRVCFYASAPTHLLADLAGWYSTSSSVGYVGEVPRRLFDTRQTGAVFAGRSKPWPVEIAVGGVRYLPDVEALVVNVTAISFPDGGPGFGGAGYVTVYPCAAERPTASNLNLEADRVVPNLVVAALDPSGRTCFYAQKTMQLIADEAGFFTALPFTRELFVR